MKPELMRFGEAKVKDVPGERIYEYPAGKNVDYSVALADVKEARLHHHNQMTELYFVAKGSGKVMVDGKSYRLNANDALYIYPKSKHKAIRTGSSFELLVICSPPFSMEDYHLDE